MTAEKYLELMEQLGREPDPNEMPPELEDFPVDVQHAIMIFGKLGDKIVPDVGYMGKDYTTIPLYMQACKVEDESLFLEAIARLDQKLIENSAEEMRRAREKAKQK